MPYFLSTVRFAEKHGIDPCVEAGSYGNNIQMLRQDAKNGTVLPFAHAYFDVVTMLAVFEHIELEQLVSLHSEIRRILRPGGRLILTVPSPWSDGILRLLARIKLASAEEIEDHKDTYSHKDIARILAEAGFERDQMKFGYFEIWLNSWTVARA